MCIVESSCHLFSLFEQERERVMKALQELSGVKTVFASNANFVLFKVSYSYCSCNAFQHVMNDIACSLVGLQCTRSLPRDGSMWRCSPLSRRETVHEGLHPRHYWSATRKRPDAQAVGSSAGSIRVIGFSSSNGWVSSKHVNPRSGHTIGHT